MDKWNKIKRDYINGKGSYRDLAKIYGVSLSNLCKRSKEEKWIELRERQRNKIVTKSLEKTAEKISDADAEFNSYAASIKSNIMKMMARWFAEHSADMYDTQDYRRMMQCYKDMMELQQNADENTVQDVEVILNEMEQFAK